MHKRTGAEGPSQLIDFNKLLNTTKPSYACLS